MAETYHPAVLVFTRRADGLWDYEGSPQGPESKVIYAEHEREMGMSAAQVVARVLAAPKYKHLFFHDENNRPMNAASDQVLVDELHAQGGPKTEWLAQSTEACPACAGAGFVSGVRCVECQGPSGSV